MDAVERVVDTGVGGVRSGFGLRSARNAAPPSAPTTSPQDALRLCPGCRAGPGWGGSAEEPAVEKGAEDTAGSRSGATPAWFCSPGPRRLAAPASGVECFPSSRFQARGCRSNDERLGWNWSASPPMAVAPSPTPPDVLAPL